MDENQNQKNQKDAKSDVIHRSIEEMKKFKSFRDDAKDKENTYGFYPGIKKTYKKERPKDIDKSNFYDYYSYLSHSDGTEQYCLEEELAKYIKNWHSTEKEYDINQKSNANRKDSDININLYQDDFFNEENVLSNILGNQYIYKNCSVIPFKLMDFIITEMEKQVFEIELMQMMRDPNAVFKAPMKDKGFIENLLNNDIEEKLHNMYQSEKLTQGYSYIIEKIVTFDLFIIYITLKNYPFYVLRRDRLEILFKSLKKYKSFPYPIGSIGADLFLLLINELYLPGVTKFQEIRETFLLDILDPNIIEIKCSDFIKVISFEKLIEMGNEKEDKNDSNEVSNNQISNFKLNDLKELTFTCLSVYSAYALYSSEDKKDNEKEEVYFENILGLFEKRFKQKRDERKENKENKNIWEKNIINDLFNLIDIGLDSSYAKFKEYVKRVNDKLISKSKETHETTTTKPQDNINLRKFLYHNIKYLSLPEKVTMISNKKMKSGTTMATIEQTQKTKNNNSSVNKKNEKGQKNNGDNISNEDQVEDKESSEKLENIRLIKELKQRLKDERGDDKYDFNNKDKVKEKDIILENYIANFINLKSKYFMHLQEIKIEDYNFDKDEIGKKKVKDHNERSKIKEKHLSQVYKQKYILRENQLINFIKNIDIWKININPLYRQELRKKLKEQIDKANNDKKAQLGKEAANNFFYVNIFDEDNSQDYTNAGNNELSSQLEKMKQLVNSVLPFNYQIYVIPDGKKNNPLTKFISRRDFIYKSIIGDFFNAFYDYNKEECKDFLDIPVQLYLKEAKHYYNLKVFNTKVKTERNDKIISFKVKDDPNDNYYYFYGSFYIESSVDLYLILDQEIIKLERGSKENIYIDIIDIYNENKSDYDCNKDMCLPKVTKINEIEKYLVNHNNNCFQVFVSAEKSDTNHEIIANSDKEYLKKFIIPIMNFGVKSLNYEAKKIVVKPVRSGTFNMTPTFLTANSTVCEYFEINYNSKKSIMEQKNNDDEFNKKTNKDIGTYSFDILLKTFIDLYKIDD